MTTPGETHQDPQQVLCDQCGCDAKVQCNCKFVLCDECKETHLEKKHNTLPLFDKNGVLINWEDLNCEIHRNELKFYCPVEGKLICMDCFIFDHRSHDLKPISEAYKEALSESPELVSRLNSSLGQWKILTEDIKTNMQVLEENSKSVETFLQAEFEREMKRLTAERDAKQASFNTQVLEKNQELKARHNEIESMIQKCQKTLSKFAAATESGNQIASLQTHGKLKSHLEEDQCTVQDLASEKSARIPIWKQRSDEDEMVYLGEVQWGEPVSPSETVVKSFKQDEVGTWKVLIECRDSTRRKISHDNHELSILITYKINGHDSVHNFKKIERLDQGLYQASIGHEMPDEPMTVEVFCEDLLLVKKEIERVPRTEFILVNYRPDARNLGWKDITEKEIKSKEFQRDLLDYYREEGCISFLNAPASPYISICPRFNMTICHGSCQDQYVLHDFVEEEESFQATLICAGCERELDGSESFTISQEEKTSAEFIKRSGCFLMYKES